jgi:hypothetical protein
MTNVIPFDLVLMVEVTLISKTLAVDICSHGFAVARRLHSSTAQNVVGTEAGGEAHFLRSTAQRAA